MRTQHIVSIATPQVRVWEIGQDLRSALLWLAQPGEHLVAQFLHNAARYRLGRRVRRAQKTLERIVDRALAPGFAAGSSRRAGDTDAGLEPSA